MLNKIKQLLGLNPPVGKEERLDIQVGVFEGRLHIKLSKKVDVVTLNKEQLSQLLAAIATQAAGIK